MDLPWLGVRICEPLKHCRRMSHQSVVSELSEVNTDAVEVLSLIHTVFCQIDVPIAKSRKYDIDLPGTLY